MTQQHLKRTLTSLAAFTIITLAAELPPRVRGHIWDKVQDTGLAHMGNMWRLGIAKGEPFSPDERAKAILDRAAKSAEVMVL